MALVSEQLAAIPWVVFHKINREKSIIINAVDFRAAIGTAVQRTGWRAEELDYSPVYSGETAEAAKARIAQGVL